MTMPVEFGSNEWMMIWGAALILFGIVIMWRTSRYDLAGAAAESAWQVATGGRTSENPTAIEQKIKDIASEASVAGKAKRAAGTVIGHFYAKVMGVVSMLMMLAGGIVLAAGIWWR